MSSRNRKVIVFCGSRGKGKSTQIEKLINRYKEKVLIYDIHGESIYRKFTTIEVNKISKHLKGVAKVINADYDLVLTTLYSDFKNGLIVLEDANFYLNSARNEMLWRMLVQARHRGTDIVLTFHSLARIPPYVYEMMNDLVLFKTSENIDRIKNKIPNFQIIDTEKNLINKHSNNYYFKVLKLMQ